MNNEAKALIRTIALKYGIRYSDILGPKRTRAVVAARRAAIREVYAMDRFSLSEIGEMFGKNASTIMRAVFE